MAFTIHLRKENFKFSGTHFTIFTETSAERLHGHNYYVGLDMSINKISEKFGFAFDFNDIKPIVKHLCDEFDEYVLVPEKSPFVKIQKKDQNVRVSFAKKEYQFPASDVRLLPLVNITSEELARYLTLLLLDRLPKNLLISRLRLTVTETHGQSVSYHVNLKDPYVSNTLPI